MLNELHVFNINIRRPKGVKKCINNAGRPKGTGIFGCETKAMRIPTHLHEDVQAFVMKKIKTEAKK